MLFMLYADNAAVASSMANIMPKPKKSFLLMDKFFMVLSPLYIWLYIIDILRPGPPDFDGRSLIAAALCRL